VTLNFWRNLVEVVHSMKFGDCSQKVVQLSLNTDDVYIILFEVTCMQVCRNPFT